MTAVPDLVAGGAVVVAVVAVAAAVQPRLPRAGRPLHRALAPIPATPPSWPDLLDHVARAIRAGSTVRTAYHHTVQRMGTPTGAAADAAVAAQALEVATALGGPHASVFEGAASTLRDRAVARAQAEAHAAQARLSARVLTAVPLVFSGWSVVTGASFRAALSSPVGAGSATLGVALNLLGWRWMRRIVDRATR